MNDRGNGSADRVESRLYSSSPRPDGSGGSGPLGKTGRLDKGGSGLFVKVLAGHLAVILTTIVILSAILTFAVENLLHRQEVRELRAIGERLTREPLVAAGGRVRDFQRMEGVFAALGVRFLLTDAEGQAVFPFRLRQAGVALRPEIMERLRRGGIVEGKGEIRRQPVTWVIFPRGDGASRGAMVLYSPVEGMARALRQIRFSLLLAGAAAFLLSLGVSGWLAKGIAGRIRRLRDVTRKIRDGDYDARAPESSGAGDEVDELTRDLNAMAARLAETREELRRFELRRQQFVSDVSHELRTPLTSIRGLIEGLRTGVVTGAERERVYALIERETLRLIRLINELLDLEKIRAGRVELNIARHRVEDLFEIVREQLAPQAEEKGLLLTAEAPEHLEVWGDYDRLLQILVNLVKNGIQFTEQGEVRLTAAAGPEGTVIRVADTGIGMTPEEVSRIWDRFYKADPSRSREKGETGLGMAIVKQLVEAHGGTIRVESRPGEGTVFTVRFPHRDGGRSSGGKDGQRR